MDKLSVLGNQHGGDLQSLANEVANMCSSFPVIPNDPNVLSLTAHDDVDSVDSQAKIGANWRASALKIAYWTVSFDETQLHADASDVLRLAFIICLIGFCS